MTYRDTTQLKTLERIRLFIGHLVTSAPIGAWKCNFPPSKEILTARPTEINDHREVTLSIIMWPIKNIVFVTGRT